MTYSCIFTKVKHVPLAEYCIKKSNDKQVQGFLWDQSILYFTLTITSCIKLVDRMAVMKVWAFILCTRHRWHKTKEQKIQKTYQADFPWTENKEVFCFTSSVSSTRSFDWNLEPLISGQIVNSFGQGKCTFDCQSGNLKNYASGNHVSTSSCMLRTEIRQILITFNVTCMSICFSCMYTNNYKHVHKWFGIFYRDNSVLMRVLHIQ